MRKVLIIGTAILLATALGMGVLLAQKVHGPRIDAEKIHDTVKYLSSDELEGRGTGQKGGDAAADWIAAQFKSYGLKPAGAKGSYFQDVPMVGVKTLAQTTFALVPKDGAPVPLKNLDDYVTSNESQSPMGDFDAPIVFVGYGIIAPEYQWDDYKGVDLKGKVALLFVSEPESNDPKFFKGKALTYYGRWTYKYEETARHGAVATLIIHRTDLASYGWDVVRNSWGAERSYLQNDGTLKLQAASWIQLDVAKKLAAMGGLDLDKLYKEAQSRDFKPIELPVKLKAHMASEVRPFTSRNVVAMLEGAKQPGEAVLYTAHYDHFGIDNSRPKGDNIYHGAVDNATGCGILLEIARVWAGIKRCTSALHPVCRGHRGRARLAGLGIFGEARGATSRATYSGFELRRSGPARHSRRGGSGRSRTHDLLSYGRKNRQRLWARHQARCAPRSGTLLPLRPFQLVARGHSIVFNQRRHEVSGTRPGVGRSGSQGLRHESLPQAERRVSRRLGFSRPGHDGQLRL